MRKSTNDLQKAKSIESLITKNFLFQDLDRSLLAKYLTPKSIVIEKLYSSRPVYTAFRQDASLEYLYAILQGGPVVIRSTPLDRIIGITYAHSCFGMQNMALSFGRVSRGFPSLVEAYKTADVAKLPLSVVKGLYDESEVFRQRYELMFELQQKFQYHLLNCSTYPPQAVATLLRALIYQERELGNQPQADGVFIFDLPVEIIAKASQLNHRTVEQVLKGLTKIGIIKSPKGSPQDLVYVVNPEELKAIYGATRDKVSWWPLK